MFRFDREKYLTQGNKIKLFCDGEEFYPQLLRRLRNAEKEIFIETFILEEGRVGKLIKQALLRAVKRGVWVSLTVDSYGSFFLSTDYIQELTDAGVHFQIFRPQPRWARGRPDMFRRLHRKLSVIDGKYAHVGGINLSDDHLTRDNPEGKRDFAAEVEGPVVAQIRALCKSLIKGSAKSSLEEEVSAEQKTVGDIDLAFVYRDNRYHRSEIEKAYLKQIKQAKKRILIANAYFFPGYRVMHALRKAAERGVEVVIVLQGDPDIPAALLAARSLYKKLAETGIDIYEYKQRPLHSKVAVIDEGWSTVGSSNLDPWSLGLNLEANLVIYDKDVSQQVERYISDLKSDSEVIQQSWIKRRPFSRVIKDTLTYHTVRWWPSLVNWIPDDGPRIQQLRKAARR